MKRLNYLAVMTLLVFATFSCSEDIDETLENADIAEESLTNQSLANIGDPLLTQQLPKAERHLKEIIATEYDFLFEEHDLNGLLLNSDYIFVEKKSGNTSYTIIVTIPHQEKDESFNQYAYLTLNFSKGVNTANHLLFGFQMDYSVSFDEEGAVVNEEENSPQTEYYTPKPSNLPSKAPKSVICNYFSNNSGGTNSSILVNYCGYTWSGQTAPAPQSVLDWLVNRNLTHNYNDLTMDIRYWYDNSGTVYTIPFSQYNSALKNEIITFYQLRHYPYFGYFTDTNNKPFLHHINKQAFLDGFQSWLHSTQDNAPNSYNYLINNSQVLVQIFNFFVDYNLRYGEDGGIYLSIPYAYYSPNQDIRCITSVAGHLQTSGGLVLLQQLGSGTITIEQFRNQFPLCN